MSRNIKPGNILTILKRKQFGIFLLGLSVILFYVVAINDATVKSEKVIEPNSLAYVSSVEGLNLRKAASSKSERIKALPYLQKVKILDREGEWYLVEVEGEKGWLNTNFLTNEKPNEQTVRDLDFSALVGQVDGLSIVLPVQFKDYNNDGQDDVLITHLTHGVNEEKEYFLYSYEDGIKLVKLMEISPKATPNLYQSGYRGFSKLEFDGDKFVFTYPVFALGDPLCCPSKEEARFELKSIDNQFIY